MSKTLEILAGCLSKLQDAAGESKKFTDHFPSIICVGGQSAGKSSIIETIVGHSFLPRGQDIVTRCPLKIRLHRIEDNKLAIVFAEEQKYDQKKEIFDNFEDVREEIEKRTFKRVGNTKNVSEDEILIDIYSSKYPGLQFIDLPGFTRITVDGQDENMVEKISQLNLKYMKDPNTFILAIQDGTQDIGTSEALNNALRKDVDPHAKRTLGVLTKLDLLKLPADKRKVASVLENKTKHLELGYFGVVSRSENGEDEVIRKDEQAEIMEEPEFKITRGLGKLGTDALCLFITKLLASKVEQLLPQLEQESKERLARVTDELKENRIFGDTEDPDEIIAQIVQQIWKKIRTALVGLDIRVEVRDLEAGAALNEIIKKGARKASQEARRKYEVKQFHDILDKARHNMVLEIGVGLLTECYRGPMKSLLEETYKVFKNVIETALKTEVTVSHYENFQELLMDIIMGEIDKNKETAEKQIEVLVDLQKVVDTQHEEFLKTAPCIRWFPGGIGASYSTDPNEKFEFRKQQKYLGFDKKLQQQGEAGDVCVFKLASETEDALMDLYLCERYMNIVDKTMLNQIPKVLNLTLVQNTVTFLEDFLLIRVQKACKGDEKKKEVLQKNAAHEENIRDLEMRQRVYTDTITVIKQTKKDLRNIRE